jgi:hypothetical protein
MDVRLSLQGDAAAAVITPFVLVLLGWIVASVARVRIARRQADAWGRTIDRLAPEAIVALLREGGCGGLEHLLIGPDRPHTRIIAAAQAGVIAATLGLSLLVSAAVWRGVPAIVGLLVTALGCGLLGAAATGYWLSQRWGLLEPITSRGTPPR